MTARCKHNYLHLHVCWCLALFLTVLLSWCGLVPQWLSIVTACTFHLTLQCSHQVFVEYCHLRLFFYSDQYSIVQCNTVLNTVLYCIVHVLCIGCSLSYVHDQFHWMLEMEEVALLMCACLYPPPLSSFSLPLPPFVHNLPIPLISAIILVHAPGVVISGH